MGDSHLSNDEFFTKLHTLFENTRQKDHGTISLSQKRLTYGIDVPSSDPNQPTSDLSPLSPLPLIIRATNSKSKERRGKKVKLTTIVDADKLEGFFVRYADVCKSGMSGLKKRDRSKAKERLKAKKKKLGAGAEVKKS